MATPELVPGRLHRSLQAQRPSPPPAAPETGNKVIEFDPEGTASRASAAPATQPAPIQRSRGFIYDGVRAGRALRAGLSRRAAACRPLPMEDVCFYVKHLDNTQLARRISSEDRLAWNRLVGLGFLVLLVVLATHAPHALLRQAGFRLEKLHQQHQALMEINDQLKVRQAMLSDLRRVTQLAGSRGLTATPPERFAWQDRTLRPPSGDGELAHNRYGLQP